MKNAFKNTFRAYKIWWEISTKATILAILFPLIETLKTLIPIFFTARLVNELTYNKNIDSIKFFTIGLIFSVFITNLLARILYRLYYVENYTRYIAWDKLFSDKFLDMDFEDVDSSSVQDLYSQIKQNSNWSGFGLHDSFSSLSNMSNGIFLIIGSLILSIELFFVKIPIGNPYEILNNSIVNIFFFFIIIGLTLLSPLLQGKGDLYWTKNTEEAKFANRIYSYSYDPIYNLKMASDIRMYNQEKLIISNFRKGNAFGLDGIIAKYAKGPMGFFLGLSKAVTSILMGIIFLYVGRKAYAGAFGIGEVTQYIGGLLSLSTGISLLVGVIGRIKVNSEFLDLTFKFLDIANRKYQGSLTVEKRADRKYEIEIKNLSFKYPNTNEWALRNINLKFNIGERIAIVGTNGSGKTTLIKLLCRLYDPTEGEILLNGIDIRKYNYAEYMSIFSVVFQDFKLLALPLGENIGISTDYNSDRAKKVLNDAGFNLDSDKFPYGLDTYLYKDISEKGIDISGGEAQKIAIARSLYDDAPFVILDEPTASLDPIAEAEIYEQFNKIIEDKTAIFISHRLSATNFADRILVFHGGNIVEQGQHNDLLKNKDGKYYELWEAQAQYYKTVENTVES